MPVVDAVNVHKTESGNDIPISLNYHLDGPENGEVIVWISGLGEQLSAIPYNTYVLS